MYLQPQTIFLNYLINSYLFIIFNLSKNSANETVVRLIYSDF